MLSPAPISRVRINDTFWSPRLQTNRTVTIPFVHRQLQETGRLDALRLEWKPGQPNPPHVFWESDVAKWIEAAACSLRTHPDPALEQQVDAVIDLLASAQQPDGYLNAYYTVVEPGQRWTNLRDKHELYCAGHILEAGVAHFEATGKRSLLDVARRLADHIGTNFGREPGKQRGYCGHPEIELALVRLHGATGESRYLDLGRYFLEERGRPPHFFDAEALARGEKPEADPSGSHEYTQSHVPIREQQRAVGHAVRAMYLYSGIADVARASGDKGLGEVAIRLWADVVESQMYVTGGIGSSRANEGFTRPYDLPNETAYAETCASIGLVFLSHRLLQLGCESRFGDALERALYNGVLSGVSLAGNSFFYVNPLALDPDRVDPEDPYQKPERTGWFGCACCPPNLARLLASFGQYIYSEGDREIAVHLYVQSEADLRLGSTPVGVRVQTEYPWKNKVRVALSLGQPTRFTLRLRLPGWCREASLLVNAQPQPANLEHGYITLRREWFDHDAVEITFAMPIERVYAHPRVEADLGRVALQRGPLIYCVEGRDLEAPVSSLALPRPANLIAIQERGLLGGVTTIQGEGVATNTFGWGHGLYRFRPPMQGPVPFKAIPYCVWGNRGPAPMAVWLREP